MTRISKSAAPAYIKSLLEQSIEEIAPLIPGIQIRYIIDQALDAVFMMRRAIGHKEELSSSLAIDAKSPLLILQEWPQAYEINEKKLQRYAFDSKAHKRELHNIRSLQKEKHPYAKYMRLRHGLLNDRMTLRDRTWRQYLGKQVRYDLVFTNAFVYPDDLSFREDIQYNRYGGLSWRLTAMPGRTALEAYGAYLSYLALQADTLRRQISSVLLALLLPLDSAYAATLGTQVSIQALAQDASWKRYWRKRLQYLQALAHIHRGRYRACQLVLEDPFFSQETCIVFPCPKAKKRAAHITRLIKSRRAFLQYCQKKAPRE